MTKKRFLIAISIVMVLILSVAVFVACNENQTKSYTVKFVDGESEVKSVIVEEGKTIADADIPADLTKDGYVFEGWYVGDVAFDKSAAITADVTYSAKWTKLHTVKFVDGDETIKTATVKDGEKLKDADIPADLTASGKAFEGWFDGTTAFDKDATITADKTFAAKWVGLFNVTFKNGEETIKVAQVKDGAVIAAADIPEDPTDDNYAFIGWFVGETAYDSSAAVTSDIVVSAKFGNINKTLIGTWKGGTLDRSSYTYIHYVLVIGADSIKADLGDGTLVDASNIVWNEDYQTYDFNLAGDTLYSFGEYYGAYSFASADYSVYTNLSKLETGVVSADETALVGTFETKGGVTIEINSTFVTINGADATEFEYSERDARYTFYIDDASASIEYDSTEGQWFYVVGGEKDQLVIASMAPAAIPEAYFGVWSNATIGDYSVTTITITADGVFDGGYKIGKVASADATSMTVKSPYGDYIFTLGDGTLTMNNGYSDIVLDKNVKVVFIAGEGHQAAIFYVAKVGADGKIDMGSFALEDPTMAAGYTFQGWFGQDDSTVEFDEDATFTQNTIFVSKIEKTGYVLTFKKSSSDSEPVVVVVDKATGKLAANQIPADLTYEDGSVFTGWYTSAGVKATADLAITADTTFIAKSVKESDYEGVWVSTESGKELTLVIKNGTISVESLRDCSYTFDTTDGAIKYMVHKSTYVFEYYTVEKTPTGVRYTYKYDDVDSTNKPQVVEYEMTALKAISGVAGSYKSDSASRFVIAENGLVTSAANTDNVFMGYVTGSSKSNFTIVYKTSSSSKVTTVKGARIDAKGNLVLGKSNADAEILIKDLKGFKSYSMADEGTLYVYTNSDDTITYVFKTSSGKYAYVKAEDIKGTIAEGEIFTITYGLYNGTYKKTNTTQTYKIVNGKLTTAGAEKGEYTAEGKGTLTINGFGDATLGEKSYKYSINAKNVVVLTGETTLGVTLDSEAKTYAEVVADGKYAVYVRSDSEKEVITIDGFGGVRYNYNNGYQIIEGTYTFTETALSISGTKYGVNGDYTLEADGKVLVGSKYVYIQKGYTVENHVSEFAGYFVNGTDTIEITVVDGNTVTVILNGSIVKGVTTNWNGTMLTLANTADYDAPKTGWYSDFTIVKDGDNVKLSHACKQSYDSSYESFETIQKDIVFTKSTKPSAETDGLEGTYKNGSNIITLDGKGNGTYNNGTEFTFTYSGSGDTKKVSDFAAFNDGENTITITSTGLTVHFSGGSGDDVYNASFTKEAAETLDAFAGTWKNSSLSWTFDGKGNVSDEDGKSYAYTITDGKAVFKTSSYTITCTLSGDNISAYYDDGFGEDCFTKSFTKQA